MSFKILKYLLSLLSVIFILEKGSCQKIDLKIQTYNTKESIPYAHAKIMGANAGGVANSEGFLQLLIKDTDNEGTVLFSAVGFETLEVPVSQLISGNSIFLREAVIALDQITVRYVDQAKKLVRKAINAIPLNYPTENQFLHGFYRESAFSDSSHQHVYYQLEAYTKSLKTSYEESSSSGHVEIEKGRIRKSQLNDSLFVKLFGGTHLPHSKDLIKRRIPVLVSSKIDRFDFEILDTLMYQEKSLFEVGYMEKGKDKIYNRIFIQDSSYAITKIIVANEFIEDNNSFHSIIALKNERIKRNFTVEYVPRQKKWILGRIRYETGFINKDKKEAYFVAEFATQSNEPTIEKSIPYEDRVFYMDVTYDLVSSMDTSFWQKQSIMLPEKSRPYLFSDSVSFVSKKSKLDKKLDLFRKFPTSVYFGYRFLNYRSRAINVRIDELEYNGIYNQMNDFSIVFGSSVAYNFQENWFVDLKMHSSISDNKYFAVNTGIFYQKNLNTARRPFHLTSGFSLQYNNYNAHLSEIERSSAFIIDNKKFNSSEVDVFASNREFAVSPFIQFGFNLNPQIKVFTGFSHPVSIFQNEGALIREKGDLINQKKFIRTRSIPFNQISNTPFRNYLISIGGSFRL